MQIGGTAVLERMCAGTGTMGCHPRPHLEAWRSFQFPEGLLKQHGFFEELPQLSDEIKGKIPAENYARMHGFDIEELKNGIPSDAFEQTKRTHPKPYQTTSIARELIG
jgi:hypothetical protein